MILFAALELTARVYSLGWGGLDPRRTTAVQRLHGGPLHQPSSLPGLPYELRPNFDGWVNGKRFVVSSRGLRDREHELTRPPSTFRVVVVGASYGMGSGVTNEQIFHVRLEERLNRAATGRTWELVNMSVGGYSIGEILTVVERKALAWDPDLVLFTTSPSQYVARQPQRGIFPDWFTFPQFFITIARTALAGWRNTLAAWWTGKPSDPPRRQTPEELRRSVERAEAIVTRLADFQRGTGIPVDVVILAHSGDWFDVLTEIGRVARSHGVGFIDASAPLRRARFPYTCAFVFDCHPDALAHRMFADAIYDALLETPSRGRVRVAVSR